VAALTLAYDLVREGMSVIQMDKHSVLGYKSANKQLPLNRATADVTEQNTTGNLSTFPE
jgi:flavin-dependent dehydrogenase